MNKVRRIDRVIPAERAFELLVGGEYGILSTASADGKPYGIPLSFCVIDNSIYFHCATVGKKIENITQNDQVSFCVVGNTEILPSKFGTKYISTIVSGKVEEAFNEEKQLGLEGLLKKYSSGYLESGIKYIERLWKQTRVFKITIEEISGKGRLK